MQVRFVPIVALFLLGTALAAPKAPGKSVPTQNKSASSTEPTKENLSPEEAEIVALKAQLETMRHYDDRLLHTVDWAFIVLVLVTGAGAIVNVLNSRRELTLLKQEIQQELSTATVALGQQFQKEQATFETSKAELLAQLENFRADILTKVSAVEEKFEKGRSSDRERFGKDIQSAREAVSSSLRGEMLELKSEMNRVFAIQFEVSQPFRAMLYQADYIRTQLKRGLSEYLADELIKLAVMIGKLTMIGTYQLTELQELLGKLPHKYAVERKKIEESLEKVRGL